MQSVTKPTKFKGKTVYPKAWLPNREGYKFLSVLSDGSIVEDVVVKDKTTGIHSISTFRQCIGYISI